MKDLCTKAKNGKVIEGNIFTHMYDDNRKNMEEDPELYLRRQAIVEHPLGTIKPQWGFDHVLCKKGKKRASADVGFIFIAYNLKRILSLIGKKGFREMYSHFNLYFNVFIYRGIFNVIVPLDYFKPKLPYK